MITANDIIQHLNDISKTEDQIVDKWLTDVFIKRAVQSGVTSLTFSLELLSTYWYKHGLMFENNLFVKAMQKRNFNIEYSYDDRPCGGCYFNISCKV